MKKIRLITDGSCLGNPGRGGWAAILRYDHHKMEMWGCAPHTTNNRMELTAAIEGLRALRVIAVFTAPDRRAMFVREADEAVLIGPSDPDGHGDGAAFGASPYLDYAELERARGCRADAVWPGWGFLSISCSAPS